MQAVRELSLGLSTPQLGPPRFAMSDAPIIDFAVGSSSKPCHNQLGHRPHDLLVYPRDGDFYFSLVPPHPLPLRLQPAWSLRVV